MGYFDGIVASLFKKDAHGNTLFYPWGRLGSGIILDNSDQEKSVYNFTKKFYMIWLFAVCFLLIFLNIWITLILLPFGLVWYHWNIQKLTSGSSKTTEKLTRSEFIKTSAHSHTLFNLILYSLGSLIFVGAGLFILQDGENTLIALATIIFFGSCGIDSFHKIYIKLRK